MSIIRPPISGDSPQDSWMNQVTEAINKGLLAPSVNPSEAAVISVDSFSAATVYLYTRTTTATAPAVLTQDLTYDYSQASFTTSPPFGSANWETSPPGTVNGDYLWIITVNISANVGQEIIPAASWSTPQIFSVNGSSSIVIEAYLRASSAPSTPTGGSYNFTTKVLTPPAGGWTQAFPSGSDPVYIVTTIATIVGSDGVDPGLTWSAPVKMVEDGATGASTNIIFQRSSTQPSTPSGSPGVPSGWYDDASSALGTALLWASSGVKPINVSNFTWSTPFRIEGESVAEVAVYRLNSNVGLTGGTYNFVTNTLTPPSGWLTSSPAITNNGDTIYRSSGIASGSAKETSAAVTFGPAVIFAQRNDGTDATDVESGLVYYNQASTTNPGTPSATNYNFTTGVFSGLTSGWQTTPVTVNITTTTALFWSSRFRIIKAPNAGTPTIIFDTPIPSVNFGTNIQSDNYIAGSSGWQIQRASGDAEFNNITARGTLKSGNFDGQFNSLNNTVSTYTSSSGALSSNYWALRDGFANNATSVSLNSWASFVDPVSNTDHVVLWIRTSSAAQTEIVSQLGRGQEVTLTRNASHFATYEVWNAGYLPEDANSAYVQLRTLVSSTGSPASGSLTLTASNVVDPGTTGYFFSDDKSVINSGTLDVANIRINGSIQAKNLDIGITLQSKSGSRSNTAGGYTDYLWKEFLRLETSDNPDYSTDISFNASATTVSEGANIAVAVFKVLNNSFLGTEGSAIYSFSTLPDSVGSSNSNALCISRASITANSNGAASSFTCSTSGSNVNVTRNTYYIFCWRRGGDLTLNDSGTGSITEVRRPE
jgi:hypothetical protein